MSKKKSLRLLVLVLSILTIAIIFHDKDLSFAADKGPIKFGLATWTEGPALRAGRAYTEGFETGIAYINSQGGILGGRKLEGVVGSQGDTGEVAKASAMRLCMKDKVKALIGPNWAVMAPAGLAAAKRFNVPFAPDQGGLWLYDQKYPGTLSLACGNARSRTMPQMRWIEKKGYKSVVILYSDIAYCHDVDKIVKERWDKPGSPVPG